MGERIAQRCDQRLSVRIYATVLLTEAQRSGGNQHLRWCHFPKKLIGEFHDEIGIAPCYWMADLVTLRGIKKDNLVRIGDDLFLERTERIEAEVLLKQFAQRCIRGRGGTAGFGGRGGSDLPLKPR